MELVFLMILAIFLPINVMLWLLDSIVFVGIYLSKDYINDTQWEKVYKISKILWFMITGNIAFLVIVSIIIAITHGDAILAL